MIEFNPNQISSIKNILDQFQFKPSKKKGQNFLIDPNYLPFLTKDLKITDNDNEIGHENDLILEIGPGCGILTQYLLNQHFTVCSVEIDRTLFEITRELLSNRENFYLLNEDILANKNKLSENVIKKINSIDHNNLYCCSNLPYSITTPFLISLICKFKNLKAISVLVQEEIAQKICSANRLKTYGILSVIMQTWGNAKIIKKVPSHVFWPKPNVNSCIVQVNKKSDQLLEENFSEFCQFVKGYFNQRRKILINQICKNKNNVSGNDNYIQESFEQIEIDKKSRPEELTPENWAILFKKLYR